jgi:predicted flap endonuclease-1-like 5' DNA nuclease
MNVGAKCATPISKLYGVSREVRFALKIHAITTSERLLHAAARYEDRQALAVAARLHLEALTAVVQRADIARVNGIGTSFARMLADVGIPDVATLAVRDARALQLRLHAFNQVERLVRRCPTLDEIVDWVAQARQLPVIVTYAPQDDETAIPDGPVVGAGWATSAAIAELSS